MRTKTLLLLTAFLLPVSASAQSTPADKPGIYVERGTGYSTERGHKMVMLRREMGKWWKDSQVAQKLQLNQDQIAQLDQIFYEHRLKLIDDGAAMEKEDLKLQNLVDADVPNEGQINAQVDQVLAARGKLEREYTMMNLYLRKVLTLDQWRQLKQIRADRGLGDNMMFFHKQFVTTPGGPLPPLPPPPKGPGEPMVAPPPPGDDSL